MNFFLKFFHKIGTGSLNAVLAVIALNCVALSTIRPLITLMNPQEPMAQKRYAALRESLTELLAIPVVVGAAFAFKKWMAPLFFRKETPEINKDVIRKIFTVIGLTVGNITIPFVATKVIGGLFKVFPGLSSSKKPSAPEHAIGQYQTPAFSAAINRRSNPRKFPAPFVAQAYAATLSPVYRTTF